jgi:hypothetical protein
MSKVSADTPSKTQQKAGGTDSLNPPEGAGATVTGAVRIALVRGGFNGRVCAGLPLVFVGEFGGRLIRAVSFWGSLMGSLSAVGNRAATSG